MAHAFPSELRQTSYCLQQGIGFNNSPNLSDKDFPPCCWKESTNPSKLQAIRTVKKNYTCPPGWRSSKILRLTFHSESILSTYAYAGYSAPKEKSSFGTPKQCSLSRLEQRYIQSTTTLSCLTVTRTHLVTQYPTNSICDAMHIKLRYWLTQKGQYFPFVKVRGLWRLRHIAVSSSAGVPQLQEV